MKPREPYALIVDDEKSIRDTLSGVLSDEGWNSYRASSGLEAIEIFQKQKPDLVLLDVWMPGMDGIEVLQKLKEINFLIPIVVMSGHGNIETAVRATKLGAFDFLEKPLSIDKILPILDHAQQILRGEAASLSAKGVVLIGESEQVVQIKHQIKLVASKNAWVLITGENGTGKEVVAKLIHQNSTRSKESFVAVNCAAIPEELIESELFGHAKGAFTNAVSSRRGRFELANGGTLFLDEIADMSLKTQAKILRILQEQEFERLGSVETIKVDVRVIAATNKDLKSEMDLGNFREDLYYRLNVVPIHLPPLKDRGADILALTNWFFKENADNLGEKEKVLTAEAEYMFMSNSWPGNVRELKNTVERITIMVNSELVTADVLINLGIMAVSQEIQQAPSNLSFGAATLKQAKTDFERAYLLDKLKENMWNVSRTADAIGIERSNLHRKLKMYEIDPKQLKG